MIVSQVNNEFARITGRPLIVHINYIIEGDGTLVNEAGELKELKVGDFALIDPNEKHKYRNLSPVKPFIMICGVPKEFK